MLFIVWREGPVQERQLWLEWVDLTSIIESAPESSSSVDRPPLSPALMSWLWEKFLKSFLLGEMTLLLMEFVLCC